MKHVKSLNKPMNSNLKKSGCGECQTSCQSACKTSCTVGNHTTVKTEIIAGLTTFMTMAYIIALNPNLLTGFGAEGQNLWKDRKSVV